MYGNRLDLVRTTDAGLDAGHDLEWRVTSSMARGLSGPAQRRRDFGPEEQESAYTYDTRVGGIKDTRWSKWSDRNSELKRNLTSKKDDYRGRIEHRSTATARRVSRADL